MAREHCDCRSIPQTWKKAISRCGLAAIRYFYEPCTYSGEGISCITGLNRLFCDGSAVAHAPTGIAVARGAPAGPGPPSRTAPPPVVPDKHGVPCTHGLSLSPSLCPGPPDRAAKLGLTHPFPLLCFAAHPSLLPAAC